MPKADPAQITIKDHRSLLNIRCYTPRWEELIRHVKQTYVMANWIVKEKFGRDKARYVLVVGQVATEDAHDPPLGTAYMPVRSVSESFVQNTRLPLQSITIPYFYQLPEPFQVELIIHTDPENAKVYEVLPRRVLVFHGKSPIRIVFQGTIDSRTVSLAGRTWLKRKIKQAPYSIRFLGRERSQDGQHPFREAYVFSWLTSDDLHNLRQGQKFIRSD